jgi:hypothetical protein
VPATCNPAQGCRTRDDGDAIDVLVEDGNPKRLVVQRFEHVVINAVEDATEADVHRFEKAQCPSPRRR